MRRAFRLHRVELRHSESAAFIASRQVREYVLLRVMAPMADSLPDDPSALKAMLIAERAHNERLLQIIKELQRHRFGRRAETLPEDQMLLGLEEVEQLVASGEAEGEQAASGERATRANKRRMNRGSLP